MAGTLATLLDECADDYAARMLHEVPEAESVDRAEFVLLRCAKRKVLSFGHSGPVAGGVDVVAKSVDAVDRQRPARRPPGAF